MTKEKSISDSMKQWEFMAETGTMFKFDYTPVKKLKNTVNECFFCEYKNLQGKRCDEVCPATPYWSLSKNQTQTCLHFNSLYKNWKRSETLKLRKLWAHRIVWMIWLIQEDSKNDKKRL